MNEQLEQPEFADAVVRLHKLVGNAVTQDRFIVVGTGSTQLIQSALYATSQPNSPEPVSVVSAAPYYVLIEFTFITFFSNKVISCFMRNWMCLPTKTKLELCYDYKIKRFSYTVLGSNIPMITGISVPNGTYIEIITSPNNPDGSLREAPVNNKQAGILIHDLANRWPQYSSISSTADHDIMLFTVSKCTGHAGTRHG
ncbi:tryptophan aminotransferase-related protein 2-like [Primulina tabacum]|uniref:tryptophan aminotransferase-related protein 2-like n=1 Tax=Primulina tabacum TaxID=48773 RepID=UPI003F5A5895